MSARHGLLREAPARIRSSWLAMLSDDDASCDPASKGGRHALDGLNGVPGDTPDVPRPVSTHPDVTTARPGYCDNEAPTRGDDQGWVSGHRGLDDPAGGHSLQSDSLSPRPHGGHPGRATAAGASGDSETGTLGALIAAHAVTLAAALPDCGLTPLPPETAREARASAVRWPLPEPAARIAFAWPRALRWRRKAGGKHRAPARHRAPSRREDPVTAAVAAARRAARTLRPAAAYDPFDSGVLVAPSLPVPAPAAEPWLRQRRGITVRALPASLYQPERSVTEWLTA